MSEAKTSEAKTSESKVDKRRTVKSPIISEPVIKRKVVKRGETARVDVEYLNEDVEEVNVEGDDEVDEAEVEGGNQETRKGNMCNYCLHKFSTPQRLKYHLEVMACFGKMYMCRRCLGVFELQSGLIDHQQHRIIKCKPSNGVDIRKIGDELVLNYIK